MDPAVSAEFNSNTNSDAELPESNPMLPQDFLEFNRDESPMDQDTMSTAYLPPQQKSQEAAEDGKTQTPAAGFPLPEDAVMADELGSVSA